MKIGDMIRLSAYGKKVRQNRCIAGADPVGIITTVFGCWYHVKWCIDPQFADPLIEKRKHLRQDLKYAK